jgi:hypothetical protein
MAITLVATPGASTANTYCTRAEADAYHAGHVSEAVWLALSPDVQDAALVQATRLLDTMVVWEGWVVDSVQARLFPRNGLSYRSGYAIPNTTLPVDLKHATAEYARILAGEDRAADSDIEAQGITELQAGPVRLRFRETGVVPKVIPDAVFYMVSQWGHIRQRAGFGVRELERA